MMLWKNRVVSTDISWRVPTRVGCRTVETGERRGRPPV